VNTKVVRALVRLLVPDRRSRELWIDTQWRIAQALAPFRDLDVLSIQLQELPPRSVGAKRLRKTTASQKRRLDPKRNRALQLVRVEIDLLLQRPEFDGRSQAIPRKKILKRLRSSYRKVRDWRKKCEQSGLTEDCHRWRRRVKDLQYQLEWALGMKEAAGLKRLAGVLGDARDLKQLERSLPLSSALRKRKRSLDRKAFRIADRTLRLTPRKWARALEALA